MLKITIIKLLCLLSLQRREEVGEKRKPLARKLVKKFSQHIIPPEKTTDEKALHILSLARVKFRIQQVGGVLMMMSLLHHWSYVYVGG